MDLTFRAKTSGPGKSIVSRRFIEATKAELKKLLTREVPEIVVVLVDGVQFGNHNVIVAMGIGIDGRKHILGLRVGATENSRVCEDPLVDLCERGLTADNGFLMVIDGSKALRKAAKSVFGDHVLIQRCRVHKKRNVRDYLPKTAWPWVKRLMNKAWAQVDPDEAIQALRSLANKLEDDYPDAAASLREGLEESVTVQRLNISGLLKKTLSTTNPIESAFDIVRDRACNVKNWKNGKMVKRWAAAGLLEAETRFHRIKGYRDMVELRDEIRRVVLGRNGEQANDEGTGSKTA